MSVERIRDRRLDRRVFESRPVGVVDAAERLSSALNPEEHSSDDVPVVDAQVLSHLKSLGAGTGEDLLGDLVKLFVVDADTQVNSMRRTIVDGTNQMAIARTAHSLQGASAALGAIRLTRACEVLEKSINGAGPPDVQTLWIGIGSVEAELKLVHAEFAARSLTR